MIIPSWPPPAERTEEDQPFFHVPRNPDDPRIRVDISSGSASLTASQLIEQEALSQKNAAAASNALSMAKYIYNYPGMPEGAKAVMLHPKLDLVAHNKMLLRCSVALDNLRRTLPPIDEDQRLALLHAPFNGTTLFGAELAKLQEANTKPAATFTVFPTPIMAPPVSYSPRLTSDEGKVFLTGGAQGSLVAGTEDRAGPRHLPPVLSLCPCKEGQMTLTVSVSQDSDKRKVEPRDDTSPTPRKNKRQKRNEDVLQTQPAPVVGRMEAYNERSLCVKYRNKGVQTSFYESTPSTQDPLGNKISPGAQRNSGHAGTNMIPYASEERDNRGDSEFIRILLKRIPGTQSFRRVASSNRFKKSERSHLCTSFSYVHYKLSAKYHAKRRLHVQDRPAGCVLSCANPSKQQEVPQVCLQKQGLSVLGTSLQSEHSPSGFYSVFTW